MRVKIKVTCSITQKLTISWHNSKNKKKVLIILKSNTTGQAIGNPYNVQTRLRISKLIEEK